MTLERRPRTDRPLAAVLATLMVGAAVSLAASVVPAQAADGGAPAAAQPCTVAGGTLDWGIKESFVAYVEGSAHGSVATDGVDRGAVFRWSGGSGTVDVEASTGALELAGSVHLTGHDGAMDLRFSDPSIVLTGGATAELRADVAILASESGMSIAPLDAKDVVIAALDLARAERRADADAITYADAPAVLRPSGVPAFAGFYPAGTPLDPVTFTLPLAPGCTADEPAPAPSVTPDASGEPVPTPAPGGDPAPDASGEPVPTPAPGDRPDAGPATAPAAEPVAPPSTTPPSTTPPSTPPVAPQTTAPSPTPVTTAPAPPSCSTAPVTAATLDWGVKESFVSYVTGTIAQGAIATSGVVRDGARFRWAGGTGTLDASSSTALVRYPGAITFTGHHGELALTLSGLAIERTGPTQARLRADVDVSASATLRLAAQTLRDVVVSELDLTTGTSASVGTTVAYTGVAAPLSASGVPVFASFYPAGSALAPVSFTLPAGAVTCDDPAAPPVPAPTPPTPRVTLAGADGGGVRPGATVRFEVSGLTAGVQTSAAVHSTPVPLGSRTASAAGAVSYRWTVPTSFPAGVHTFRLTVDGREGAVSQTFRVAAAPTPEPSAPDDAEPEPTASPTPAPAAPEVPVCVARVVAGATLDWGLRDSFLTYIEGPIAHGEIATAGVTRAGSVFRWRAGTGAYHEEGRTGRVSYPGSVSMTGHDGVLDLTFSDPRIVLGAGGATLVIDVRGTTLDGDTFDKRGVGFATLTTSAGQRSVSGSRLTYTGVPAVLTPAGASAFSGFYEAGEALAPVTFSLPLGAATDCGIESGTLPRTGTDPVGLTTLAAGVLLLGAVALVVSRRRRAA